MAKFKDLSLDLETGEHIDFDDADTIMMGYDGAELYINSTISGVRAAQPYHMVRYDQLTESSGTLQDQIDDINIDIENQNEFIELIDTPTTYSGYSNYIVNVNSSATGLEFTDFGEFNLLFGTNFIYALDPTESSTSSTTFIEKLTLSRTVPTGTYRVGWYFEWDVSSESAIFFARVQINNTDDIGTLASTAAAASTSWSMTSGFHYLIVTEGTLQIDLDYRCAVSNKTAYIRNARLEFWRTE